MATYKTRSTTLGTVAFTLALAASLPSPNAAQELCGSWELVEGIVLDDLTSITDLTVITPDDIWAVGSHSAASSLDDTPFSVHWDGSSWSVVPVPCPAHPLEIDCALGGASGVATDDVWAVGNFTHPDEFDQEPFVVHWDGSQWSWVPAPTQPNGEGARLFDVRAIATDDVWAVGTWPGQPAGGQTEPLAMHWDGSSWQTVFVPYTGELSFEHTSLHRIAVLASDNIWAIGNRSIGLTPHRPFIVHWDGTSWSIMETRPEPLYRGVTDIAAFASDDIWISALKHNELDLFDPFPVVLHWDGSTWTEHDDAGAPEIGSSNFAEVASDNLWSTANGELSHWDGQAWSQVADFPDPSLLLPLVLNFEPVSACEAWAVAQHSQGNMFLHLKPLGAPQSASLDGFTVRRGLLLGGDLGSLLMSDDDRLDLDADMSGSRFVTQTIVDATSPVAVPSRLDVRAELSASAPGVRGRLTLWDWSAGAWRVVSSFTASTSDGMIEALAVPNPERFVQAADGAVRLQLQTLARDTQAPDGYVLSVDLVAIDVTP